jgi:hypothetical protein
MDDFVKLEQGVEKIRDAVLKGVGDNLTGKIDVFSIRHLMLHA